MRKRNGPLFAAQIKALLALHDAVLANERECAIVRLKAAYDVARSAYERSPEFPKS